MRICWCVVVVVVVVVCSIKLKTLDVISMVCCVFLSLNFHHVAVGTWRCNCKSDDSQPK